MLLLSLKKGMNFSTGFVYPYQNPSMRFYFILIFLLAVSFRPGAQNTFDGQRKEAAESKSETVKDLDNSVGALGLQTVKEQVYQKKSLSWYVQQKNSWKQVTESNKKDAEAWLNYYRSARYAGSRQQELDEIMKDIEEHIPGSFTAHYLAYIHSNRDVNKGYDLQKAWLLAPNRKELYKELALFFTWKQDADNLKKTLITWKSLNDIPDALFSYSKNLLLTPSSNAVLITDGEFDTYPLWILQQTERLRTDVTVINLSILHQSDYRRSLFKSAGIQCSYQGIEKKEILQTILRENPSKPIYISLTVDMQLLTGIEDQLNTEGLAYKVTALSEGQYDSRVRLANNFENVYKLDELRKTIQGSETMDREKVVALYQNYVVCGLMLYDYYTEKGEKSKASRLADDLKKLAAQAGKEQLVNEYIGK